MKKFIVLAVLSVLTLGANAQYRGSYGGYRPVAPSSSRYRDPGHYWGGGWNRPYFGLRVGPSFSNICGDDFTGGSVKTGVNVGMAIGLPLSRTMPLYFETGLYYTEKGEKTTSQNLKYNLDYLEIPFVFKYKCYLNDHLSLQPYFGGYAAIGVAGKTRVLGEGTLAAYNSFGDEGVFRRGDAGIKMGVGFGYDLFYADITYDWGLANITHDSQYDGKTGAFMVNVGVNF